MSMVGFFDEVAPDKCGGKGKNLIALTEQHFPVPPGFIVTVDAYSLFKSKMEMPESVKQAVSDCYAKLVAKSGSTSVAVRSSASAEDSATASFAGQFDTYLDIEGVHSVLEHVVECWCSLHSERSVLYRKMMKFPDEDLEMAVVIQTMLTPRSAGVVFTANPYTKDENVMIVESCWGYGENVVSGKVTPDYFEISKNDSFEIVKKMVGSEHASNGVGSDLAEDGSENKLQPIYSIAEEPLKNLCAMAKEIECALGSPQDIEWALADNGSFSILQSRPLTGFRKR
jgi:phosphoenolpyruvate synthase/pyruvate phosphate dikinase